MTDTADLNLWVDNPCHTAIPLRYERLRYSPAGHITAPRKLWHENVEARIRYALANMLPDTRMVIEGVSVERYTPTSGQLLYYTVNGETVADFDSAVARITELAQTGKAI